jgi:hypothetical protein
METGITAYETPETTSEAQPVGQFFSLPPLPSETLREIPKEWIDRLFVRLWAWYGKAIEDKWGADTELAKSVWQQDLAGLSMAQLKAGMEKCRDSCKFPPNLPEFRALCLNAGMMIDAEREWRLCLQGRYPSAAHYWTVQELGYREFHETPWHKARFNFPSILRNNMILERSGDLEPMPMHVRERLELYGNDLRVAL